MARKRRQIILAYLERHGPCTTHQLATGIKDFTYDSLSHGLRVLKQNGDAHIARWDRVRGRSQMFPNRTCAVAVYALGPGRNAPMPVLSERQKEANKRKNAKKKNHDKAERDMTVNGTRRALARVKAWHAAAPENPFGVLVGQMGLSP